MAKFEIPPETGMWRPRPCYHDPLANNNKPCAECAESNLSKALDRLSSELPEVDPKFDAVNHPPHYNSGSIECIDAIKAALTPEEFRGYCKGNAFKYIWRENHKDKTQDLKKARFYLERLIDGTDK